jgi:hypothetical protein
LLPNLLTVGGSCAPRMPSGRIALRRSSPRSRSGTRGDQRDGSRPADVRPKRPDPDSLRLHTACHRAGDAHRARGLRLGNISSRLAELGHAQNEIEERITVRPPSSEEAAFLRMTKDQRVYEIVHIGWTIDDGA